MEDIVLSAPGKLILHGEHAVVYGKRALATSLNLRTFLRLKKTSENFVSAALPDVNLDIKWPLDDLNKTFQLPMCDVAHPSRPSPELLSKMKAFTGLGEDETDTKHLAAVAFLYLYSSLACSRSGGSPVDVLVCSHLPPGAGLGSSAAYSTCLAAAFLLHTAAISSPTGHSWKEEDLKLVNSWAFQAECIIHGNPSGIDNSVSTHGGALRFQSGQITTLTNVPMLQILLFNTKVPRSTKALVAGVRLRYEKYKTIISPLLDSIEAISDQCERLFQEMTPAPSVKHYQSLQDLMGYNHQLLQILGVSHPALENVRSVVSRHGLVCKLTGAGGGGCAFSILPPGFNKDTITLITSEMEQLGYSCWETKIGGGGVSLHSDIHNGALDLPTNFR